MSRPVRLFSIVFNDRYLDWFERGCVPSLMWPRNREALKLVKAWDLWTTEADRKRAKAAADRVGIPVEIHPVIPPLSWDDKEAMKPALTRVLIEQMGKCAQADQAFFWVAPDSIFGDGTIGAVMTLGAVPGVCVSFFPLRVKAEGFIEAMGGPLTNAQLVKLAFTRLHPAFEQSDATRPYTNSFESGVSWRRLDAGLYAVTHRNPSAYLMQPTIGDYRWFADMKKFGAYDHTLPKRLIEEHRHRIVGSSDAAFVVELTPEDAHVPALQQTSSGEPDRYRQQLHHHAVHRISTVIWREDGA